MTVDFDADDVRCAGVHPTSAAELERTELLAARRTAAETAANAAAEAARRATLAAWDAAWDAATDAAEAAQQKRSGGQK